MSPGLHLSCSNSLVAATLALAWLVPAAATGGFAPQPQFDSCVDKDNPLHPRMSSCTVSIASGRLSERDLAIAFFNRGSILNKKNDFDRAIADFDQAIRLD